MTINKLASTLALLVVAVGVAFSTGYWSGTITESSQTNSGFEARLIQLEDRLSELESRMTEQLVVLVTSLKWDSAQFAVLNIGTANVTISEIRINGLTNSSGPGWAVDYGDNKILPGQGISITLNVLKYFSEGLLRDSESYKFAFITSTGNIYSCVPMSTCLPYAGFEDIEITGCYAVKNSTHYLVTVDLKNTGSVDATINYLSVNGRPSDQYGCEIAVRTLPATLQIGKSARIFIEISATLFEPGTILDLKFQSTSGIEYPQMVALPTDLQYTRFEKIEITSCYAVKDPTSGNYTVTVQLKNTGSQDASIAYVLVNGKPSEQYEDASSNRQIIVNWTTTEPAGNGYLPEESMTLQLGKSGKIELYIDGSLYEAGTTLDLKFHSAAGKDYPQMLALP